ncbi:MAG: hypothetical protein Kow0080_15040 [Candidatus Promineifilaceae bacterium]
MKKRLLVALFLLFVLILTACGGEEITPTVPESPTEPPATATSLPPTATTVPEPTTTTTPESTAITVQEPTATTIPDPTSEPTDEPEESSPISETPQSACDNPWFPIREGATWTYEGADTNLVWTITSVEGDLENATAQMQADVAGVVLNYQWDCTPEGIASFDVAALTVPISGFDLNFDAESMSGQFLLPAEQMTLGTTWEFVVTMNVTGALPNGTAVSGTMTHTQSVAVIGTDPVTVDGRTVDGLQIQRDSVIEMSLSIPGTSVDIPPLTMSQTQTMARDIGITEMVTSTSVSGAENLTLVSWFVP